MQYDQLTCSCSVGQRPENCDFQYFIDTGVFPENYTPELCPYIEGGINFVGCEKWVRTFIDGDTIFDVPTQSYIPLPNQDDICLDNNGNVYDVVSEHTQISAAHQVVYDGNGNAIGAGAISPDYWKF